MKNIILFLTFFVLISQASMAQTIFEKIDSIARISMAENPQFGFSIGACHEKTEYYMANGAINPESSKAINKNTVFEIASITKIITANLIAQASMENRLNCSDFIDGYLPPQYKLNKNIQNKVTISDLASHQSGLPDIDFRLLIERNDQQPISSVTPDTLSSIINGCEELLDHGQYRYSTIGYALLGQILETIYQLDYQDILTEKISHRLELTNTLTENFDVANIAQGHGTTGLEQELLLWNVTAPAGLIKSSASDMITYIQAILDEESVIGQAAMLTEEILYKEEQRAIGLGTNMIIDGDNLLYLKTGDSMGQSSVLCYDRANNWGMIILLDHRDSKVRNNILNEIYEAIVE